MATRWLGAWALTVGLAACSPISGIPDSDLCGTSDATFDASPAPVLPRSAGASFTSPTSVATTGSHLASPYSDAQAALGWTEDPKAAFTVQFEGPGVLSEIESRCGAVLPGGPDAYALMVRPSGVLIAGAPPGQAFALATLRQLSSGGQLPHASVLDGPTVPRRIMLEGFYGAPWSWAQRHDMIPLASAHKFDAYYYAPKGDYLSRFLWQTPYDPGTLAEAQSFVADATDYGLTTCWAISPGGAITYGDPAGRVLMENKLQSLINIGVSCFVLAFDDTPKTLDAADAAEYPSFAAAQVDFIEAMQKWLAARPGAPTLTAVVPNDYSTLKILADPAYTATISTLPKSLDLGWTGIDIVSGEVTLADVTQATTFFARPPSLGDNYPVAASDTNSGPLNMLPIDFRDPAAIAALPAYGGNAMNVERASIVALASLAELGWNPNVYVPSRAYTHGLATAAGGDSPGLPFLADETDGLNTTGLDTAPALRALLDSYAPEPGGNEPLAQAFTRMVGIASELTTLNAELLSELQPWIAKMQAWGTFGGHLLAAVRLGTVPAATITALNTELAYVVAIPAVLADAPLEAFAQQEISGLMTE